jgi:hypothetical protein
MIVDRVYINCALRSLFYQLSQVNSEQIIACYYLEVGTMIEKETSEVASVMEKL